MGNFFFDFFVPKGWFWQGFVVSIFF